MKNEVETLEKLRIYFSRLPVDFVVIYQPKLRLLPFKLKWKAARGRKVSTRAQIEKLAMKYEKIAAHCYLFRRTVIMVERLAGPNSKIRQWHGVRYAVGKDTVPGPANALGQRWWQVVVGKGPLRAAGYVIVARIAAKTKSEVNDHIAKISAIISDASQQC